MSDEAATTQISATSSQLLAALSDPAEVLLRQVHPDLLDGDQPASSAFLPNSGDEDQLSTDRSSMTTAKDAYDLYVSNNRRSAGTYGVSVGEFRGQGLSCFPDPIESGDTTHANPAHARVDFSGFGTSQRKKMAQRLRNAAVSRGVLHKP